jgi:SET domain-containing protein
MIDTSEETRMMLVNTYLAPSKIHGFGVFAKENVAAGTLMWEYVPGFDLELDPEHFQSPAREYIAHYGSKFAPDAYLLCGDDARFMNHSGDPNMSGAGDRNYAIRVIRAGEEITCNYREFDLSRSEY